MTTVRKFHHDADPVPTDPAERKQLVRWLEAHPLWLHPFTYEVDEAHLACTRAIGIDDGHKLGDVATAYDGGMYECVSIDHAYVCPETERVEDDDTRNTALRVWIEAGGWCDMSEEVSVPEPAGGWTESTRWLPGLDYRLDCGAADMETALCELAVRVRFYYGDDREDRDDVPVRCTRRGLVADLFDDDAPACGQGIDGYCITCGYAVPEDA